MILTLSIELVARVNSFTPFSEQKYYIQCKYAFNAKCTFNEMKNLKMSVTKWGDYKTQVASPK